MERLNVEDDEEWAKKEGVPSFEEPFLQKYLQGRDALITQEKRQRSDHAFRETLSPMAAEAAAIVSQIRYEERNTIWTKDYEDSLAEGTTNAFPGMMFHLAREKMEQTKLWKIVKRMPKGALLHCHLEAMPDLDWLFERIFTIGGMCIQAEAPLSTEASRDSVTVSFAWRKPANATHTSIWSGDYTGKTFVPIEAAAEAFPAGGKDGFKRWLNSRAAVTETEFGEHHKGPNAVWTKFVSCFTVLGSILHYEPIWREFIQKMLRALYEDGIKYVDIRAAFKIPFYASGSETPEPNNTLPIKILDDEIENFLDSEDGKGFWGARLIWTDIRHLGTKDIIAGMKECISLKERFPELIAGYDLVGQEDLGRPLSDLTPELFWFKKSCAEHGVDIPFFFHAGETLGDGDETDENLFDAVLLGTRRIGHGFSLFKHPLLIDMIKERKILVESCPISNEVLRLTGSIMSHPLPALLARGVPVALCNDDPAILGHGHSGMTHDFWQALQGWENLGLEGLGSLAENSVRYASFDDYSAKDWQKDIKDGAFGKGIRAQCLKEWARDWEHFCQWVVKEFSPDQDSDTQD